MTAALRRLLLIALLLPLSGCLRRSPPPEPADDPSGHSPPGQLQRPSGARRAPRPDPASTAAAQVREVTIAEIQGRAHRSPLVDQTVRVSGALVHRTNDGRLWLQSLAPDEDPATSEGLCVYPPKGDRLLAAGFGDRVEVVGEVRERAFQDQTDGLTVTCLVARSGRRLARGEPPAPIVLGERGRRVPDRIVDNDSQGRLDGPGAGPFDPEEDGIDFWESLEGMLVQVDEPVCVSGTHYGTDYVVVGDNGRHAGLLGPRGALLRSSDDGNPERILVTHAFGPTKAPSRTVGERLSGPLRGVVDYTWSNYKLLPATPLPGNHPSPIEPETTALTGDAEHLTIATWNIENFFPEATFHDGRRRAPLVTAVLRDRLRCPDIVALQEVQDNSGPANDGTTAADRTLQTLADSAADAGYGYLELPPANNTEGGEPGGNIRCAYLYRQDRVGAPRPYRGKAPHRVAVKPVPLEAGPGDRGNVTLAPPLGRIGVDEGSFRGSRRPLAAAFTFNGHHLLLVNCHLKSKWGDSGLMGALQPPKLGSERKRMAQAEHVADVVKKVLEMDPLAKLIVLGDLNDFPESPPLQALRQAGLYDLIGEVPTGDRYTYIFNGNAQVLDHVLVGPALLKPRPEVDIVHLNTEFSEGVQASDHEPIVVRIHLPPAR